MRTKLQRSLTRTVRNSICDKRTDTRTTAGECGQARGRSAWQRTENDENRIHSSHRGIITDTKMSGRAGRLLRPGVALTQRCND